MRAAVLSKQKTYNGKCLLCPKTHCMFENAKVDGIKLYDGKCLRECFDRTIGTLYYFHTRGEYVDGKRLIDQSTKFVDKIFCYESALTCEKLN